MVFSVPGGWLVSLVPPVPSHSHHTGCDNAFFPGLAEDLLQQHLQGNPHFHPWSRWDLLQPSPLIQCPPLQTPLH